MPFIGRQKELDYIQSALRKKTASLIVIKGRRRIGKSRLVDEFAKGHVYYRFSGLAPDEKITAQTQRDYFASLLSQQTGLPEIKTDDWTKLFALLNERTKSGSSILLFDEITWMASDDPTFLAKLHAAWETYFKHNPELILILCGSVSAWIEKNILGSTGYFGRVSINLSLHELPVSACNDLMMALGFKGSEQEKLMLLGVMGGIPWYIEHIDPGLSAIENIKRLCFVENGLLVDDFNRIFRDLFGEGRRKIQKSIVKFLADGPAEYAEISKNIAYPSGGSLTDYLNELELSGFISRDYSWNLKTGKKKEISRFRLSDNYLRFYLKYIEPKLAQIQKGQFQETSVDTLPAWNTILGLQIENLILNNRKRIQKILHINPSHIVNDNPFLQKKTSKQRGCQIDYLIQTKFKTLYVIEIKFFSGPIGCEVIQEVQEKISRLNLPRGLTPLPVLAVANGITRSLIEQDYFVKIIHLADLLQSDQI